MTKQYINRVVMENLFCHKSRLARLFKQMPLEVPLIYKIALFTPGPFQYLYSGLAKNLVHLIEDQRPKQKPQPHFEQTYKRNI